MDSTKLPFDKNAPIRTDALADFYKEVADDASQKKEAQEAAMLMVVAEGHINEEDDVEALKAATSAKEKFSQLGNNEGVADAIRIIVHISIHQRTGEEALQIVEEGSAAFEKAGDRKGVAKMLLSESEINTSMGKGSWKRDEMFEALAEAIKIFAELDDNKMRGIAMLETHRLHVLWEEVKLAGEGAFWGRHFIKQAGNKRAEVAALHYAANAATIAQDHDAAAKASNEGLDRIQDLGLKTLEAFELQSISRRHLHAERARKALPLAEEALEIYRSRGSRPARELEVYDVMFAAKMQIALQSETQSEVDRRLADAMELAQTAETHFEELGFKRGKGAALNMMATVQEQKADRKAALKSYEKALQAFREANDWKSEGETLKNLANLHIEENLFGKALVSARVAVEVYEKDDRGGPGLVSDGLIFLGRVHQKKGELKAAIARITEAQTILQESGDRRGEYDALRNLAEVYLANNEFKAALRVASEAREICEDLEYDEGVADTLATTANAHLSSLQHGSRRPPPGSSKYVETMEKALKAAKESASMAAHSQMPGISALRGSALSTLADGLSMCKRYEEVVEVANEAVMLFRELGDFWSEAEVMLLSADAYFNIGKMDDARPAAEEAVDLFQYAGDAHGERLASELLAKIAPPVMMQQQQWLQMQQTMMQDLGHAAPQQPMGGAIPFQPKQAQVQQQAMAGGQSTQLERAAGAKVQLSGLSKEALEGKIREVVLTLIGEEEQEGLSIDEPLMNAGLTSNTAILFRDILTDEVQGVKLPPTLVFDYPSISDITDFIING